jgi:hypothetical protein
MIEIRVVDNGLMCRPDFEYRYKLPENETYYDKNMKIVEWSDWETAEWIKADDCKEWVDPEDTQND